MLIILNFPRLSFSVWNMSLSKLKRQSELGCGGGLCGGLLIGFCLPIGCCIFGSFVIEQVVRHPS